MGPGGFFPTNPDLADILGDTDFDFDFFLGPKFLAWAQLGPSKGPGLGPGLGPAWARAWARLGPGLGTNVSLGLGPGLALGPPWAQA